VRFIVDAQLPPALARWLVEAGHDAQHVEEIGLRDAEDSPIWRYAFEKKAVLLTKDEDFAVRVGQSQSGPVVVWLRIGNCSNRGLLVWFGPLLPAILSEIEKGNRIIEVR
jgi:predicted nuclease of predicted toxin-antitoxin system